MEYRGHVKNGVVVLEGPVCLPEGTVVRVEPVEPADVPSLADQFRQVIGIVKDMPPDMAENHDHYIHGTPKK